MSKYCLLLRKTLCMKERCFRLNWLRKKSDGNAHRKHFFPLPTKYGAKLLKCWQVAYGKKICSELWSQTGFTSSLSFCFILVCFHWRHSITCNGMENQAVFNYLPLYLLLSKAFLKGDALYYRILFPSMTVALKLMQGRSSFPLFSFLKTTCALPNQSVR